jgi:hypothetical protein
VRFHQRCPPGRLDGKLSANRPRRALSRCDCRTAGDGARIFRGKPAPMQAYRVLSETWSARQPALGGCARIVSEPDVTRPRHPLACCRGSRRLKAQVNGRTAALARPVRSRLPSLGSRRIVRPDPGSASRASGDCRDGHRILADSRLAKCPNWPGAPLLGRCCSRIVFGNYLAPHRGHATR